MADTRGEIIAMGGGGFTTQPNSPMLDDFVLSRARRTPARVCFVPTASADSHSARAYRVEAREGRVSEQVLSTRFLGAAADAREATS